MPFYFSNLILQFALFREQTCVTYKGNFEYER